MGEDKSEAVLFPVVQQVKGDLHTLRDQTFPELTREVAELKRATRMILDLLRPPELLELPEQGGAAKTIHVKDKHAPFEDDCQDLPLLPSAIADEQQAQPRSHEQFHPYPVFPDLSPASRRMRCLRALMQFPWQTTLMRKK